MMKPKIKLNSMGLWIVECTSQSYYDKNWQLTELALKFVVKMNIKEFRYVKAGL